MSGIYGSAVIVDLDEVYSIQQSAVKKCGEWSSVLEDVYSKVDTLGETDAFEGQLADSVKNYINEVHCLSLAGILSALDRYIRGFYLYWYGYKNEIDGGLGAYISEDELTTVTGRVNTIVSDIFDVEDRISSTLQDVSDLVHCSIPSSSALVDNLEEIRNRCNNLKDAIYNFESTHASSDFADVDETIDHIQSIIQYQMGDKRIGVRDYQPGMVSVMTNVAALSECLNRIQEFQEESKDELEKALACEQEMLQEIQEKRQWAKWVATGIAVVGSITLAVVTAGGATPLVCAAVGAGVGLTSAAANGFADNYVQNGSFVNCMDWKKFGKDCVIGTVTGAVTGYMGAVAQGSSVVKPMDRAIMNTTKGVLKNGTEGLINMTFDVGDAIISGQSLDVVMSVTYESTEDMMRDVTVGMASDAIGGYVGGVVDANYTEKTFGHTFLSKTMENLAGKEAKIGSGVTLDILTNLSDGDSGIDILNTVNIDFKEGTLEFVKDEGKVLSKSFSTSVNERFKDADTLGEKSMKVALNTAGATAFETAGNAGKGALEQYLDEGKVDGSKIWKEDLGGGTEIFKSGGEAFADSAAKEYADTKEQQVKIWQKNYGKGDAIDYKDITDDEYKTMKFQNSLNKRDYDHDGKIEVVTFKNFSGYSVLKEDYDAAVEVAGGPAYEGRRAQDILGVPRNVSFSDGNVEVHKYNITSLKKSDYSGKGSTNAIKVEHK